MTSGWAYSWRRTGQYNNNNYARSRVAMECSVCWQWLCLTRNFSGLMNTRKHTRDWRRSACLPAPPTIHINVLPPLPPRQDHAAPQRLTDLERQSSKSRPSPRSSSSTTATAATTSNHRCAAKPGTPSTQPTTKPGEKIPQEIIVQSISCNGMRTAFPTRNWSSKTSL